MTDRKKIYLEGKERGEELRGIEERKIIIRIYYMKNNLFSIK